MAKLTSIKDVSCEFEDIKRWFDNHMSLDKIDLNDQDVYEYVYHDGRFPGIFQCTAAPTQKFFRHAQPRTIIDIAALTSIWRPGPLAAHVDKLYLESKNEGKEYDWGDKRINELLKDTYGLLIFQEGVMMLAEKVAGFPKEKCDEVRRAIMKRSISGGDAAKAKVDEMKSDFVTGAIKNGYSKVVAEDLYEKIAYFSGYAFNKSHAVAYAVDSYYCAWLLKYYEEQWLASYLEVMSRNDDDRAKAFSEVRELGYQIVPIDVQYASTEWTVLPGKKLMPSLLACKGVGISAAEELIRMRPFSTLEELLWDENGQWKLSKFNRRALEAMVNVEAFNSLDIIGEEKLFKNYAHMYKVLIENNNEIKKSTKKEPALGKRRFFELARELRDCNDWTRQEYIDKLIGVFGSVDVDRLVPAEIIKRLANKGVVSIDEYMGNNVYWFFVADAQPKKSKSGRTYMMLNVVGQSSKAHRIFMWSWDGIFKFNRYALVVGELNRNEFGFVTSQKKLKTINV